MYESVDVVFGYSFCDPLCTFNVYVLEIEISATV